MRTLPQHVHQLYLDLSVLSHGNSTAWSASGSGVPESRAPTGEPNPPHLQFIRDWERRGESAVQHWRTELGKWRGHGVIRTETSTEDDWIIEDGRGQSPEDVARRFRATPTRVRRLRAGRNLNIETGQGAYIDRTALAKEMRAQGKTDREIAFELRWSKSSVNRTRKAA